MFFCAGRILAPSDISPRVLIINSGNPTVRVVSPLQGLLSNPATPNQGNSRERNPMYDGQLAV